MSVGEIDFETEARARRELVRDLLRVTQILDAIETAVTDRQGGE